MDTPQRETRLIDLPSFTDTRHIVNLEDGTFLVLTSEGLKHFNKQTNKTSDLALTEANEHEIKLLAYNPKSKELYAYTKNGLLTVFAIKSGETWMCLENKEVNHQIQYECGEYFLFIKDYFHIFSSFEHWIIPVDPEALPLKCATPHCVAAHGQTIHVPSKEIILLIGGDRTLKRTLWIHSLKTNKWSSIENIFDGYQFGAVLTSDQRYVVLLGGWRRLHDDDEWHGTRISVMDLENEWKIRESSIRLTASGQCYAAKTGGIGSKNDLLVAGYIRECFKTKEFVNMQLPPVCIMRIIAVKYDAELIHWINSDGTHKGIYLEDLLLSLQ